MQRAHDGLGEGRKARGRGILWRTASVVRVTVGERPVKQNLDQGRVDEFSEYGSSMSSASCSRWHYWRRTGSIHLNSTLRSDIEEDARAQRSICPGGSLAHGRLQAANCPRSCQLSWAPLGCSEAGVNR